MAIGAVVILLGIAFYFLWQNQTSTPDNTATTNSTTKSVDDSKEPTTLFIAQNIDNIEVKAFLYDRAADKLTAEKTISLAKQVLGQEVTYGRLTAVQYEPTNKLVYLHIMNWSGGPMEEVHRITPKPYFEAIVTTPITGDTTQTVLYATESDTIVSYVLHPSKPLMYVAQVNRDNLKVKLVEVNTETKKSRDIATLDGAQANGQLSLSADGSELFQADQNHTLYAIAVKDGKTRALATDNDYGVYSVSPDNKSIVSLDSSYLNRVQVMNMSDASKKTFEVSKEVSVNNFMVQWSGDNERFLVSTNPTIDEPNGVGIISTPAIVSANDGSMRVLPVLAGTTWYTWAPWHSWVVAKSSTNPYFMYNVDTNAIVALPSEIQLATDAQVVGIQGVR